jgi:hypothetical protein
MTTEYRMWTIKLPLQKCGVNITFLNMKCKITNSAKTDFLNNDYFFNKFRCIQTYVTDMADPVVGHWLLVVWQRNGW